MGIVEEVIGGAVAGSMAKSAIEDQTDEIKKQYKEQPDNFNPGLCVNYGHFYIPADGDTENSVFNKKHKDFDITKRIAGLFEPDEYDRDVGYRIFICQKCAETIEIIAIDGRQKK